jgi:hydrogenase expression/formation protein HypC
MCLAIPGQLIRWLRREVPFCQAEVDFLGTRRVCNLSCVPEAEPGQYVIVHAGVAISVVDAPAAARWLHELQSLGEEPTLEEGEGGGISQPADGSAHRDGELP